LNVYVKVINMNVTHLLCYLFNDIKKYSQCPATSFT